MSESIFSAADSDLPLVLGGNVFGWSTEQDEAFAILDAFVAGGGKHIDTADAYNQWLPNGVGGESETIIGDWLTSRENRDQVFIATKVGSLTPLDNLRADTIAQAVEGSLSRLKTDYIDLYWAHRDDDTVPQDETVAAFDALVQAGKVRYVGASNFSGARLSSALDTANAHSWTGYSAVQPNYNLMNSARYEADLAPVVAGAGLACVPYYGLARGFLTGKYRPGVEIDSVRAPGAVKYLDDRGLAVLAELDAQAAEHDVPVAAIALAWLNQQPGVLAPIASARTAEQLQDLLPLAGLTLSADELARLRTAAS